MKIADIGTIVLVSCIIEPKDMQVWLRQFSLILNAYKVMKALLNSSGKFDLIFGGGLISIFKEDWHNSEGIEIQAEWF